MRSANHSTWTNPNLLFGGIKNSVYGRELSTMGIQEFVDEKLVRVASINARHSSEFANATFAATVNKNLTTRKKIMKMTKTLLLGAVAAAALIGNQKLLANDFSPSDLANRAVAASPRAREQFPWLTRQASPRTESTCCAESALSVVQKNHAFASSPRMREQFPELARTEQPSTIASAKPGTGESQLAEVKRNRALAASPRMVEQFPELVRGYGSEPAKTPFEVAPLK